MKILVFGALNYDKTYKLKRFTKSGETVKAKSFDCFCGGKGFNQAVALRRAGNEVFLAGSLGTDGEMFLDALNQENIRPVLLRRSALPTGHAVIQVDEQGENCIIIAEGANGDIPEDYIPAVLDYFEAGDLIVLQNEIRDVRTVLRCARERQLQIALNPSPVNEGITAADLGLADFLFLNEVEGELLTGEKEPREILRALHGRYPDQMDILTLGERGACCMDEAGTLTGCGIFHTKTVDTTAAGDTYMGYFLSEYLKEKNVLRALKTAAAASGLSVSRRGASASIPCADEVAAVDLSAIDNFWREGKDA